MASRLEALNKEYGSLIIIGESTYKQVYDAYLCEFLGYVSVNKGASSKTHASTKTDAIAVYTLLGPKEAMDPNMVITAGMMYQVHLSIQHGLYLEAENILLHVLERKSTLHHTVDHVNMLLKHVQYLSTLHKGSSNDKSNSDYENLTTFKFP